MKCPRCGNDIGENEKICRHCGEQNPWYTADNAEDVRGKNRNSYVPVNPPPNIRVNYHREPPKVLVVLSAVSRALLYLIIFFSCQLAVTSAYMSAVMYDMGITVLDDAAYNAVLAQTNSNFVTVNLVSNLIALLTVCLMQTVRRRPLTGELGTKSMNYFRLPSLAIFGIAFNVFISSLIDMLPIPSTLTDALNEQYSYAYGGPSLALEIVSIAVVVPIVEEIFFRGLILSRLRGKMGAVAAVLISAVLFGLVHGTVIAVAYSFVLGLILAAVTLIYDSTLPAIACHIGFNLTSYLLSGVGGVPQTVLFALSVVLLAFFAYRIFIRRPTFSDIIADRRGHIRAENGEEKKFLDEVHTLSEREDVTPEMLQKLSREWDRLLSLRRERRRNGSGKNDNKN